MVFTLPAAVTQPSSTFCWLTVRSVRLRTASTSRLGGRWELATKPKFSASGKLTRARVTFEQQGEAAGETAASFFCRYDGWRGLAVQANQSETLGAGKGGRGIWILLLIPIVVCVGLGMYVVQPLFFPAAAGRPNVKGTRSAASLADASAALRRKDYEQAGNLARDLLLADPGVADAYLIAGEAALRLGDVETSLIYYGAVPESARPQYITSLWSIGSVCLYQGKLREAEDYFRRTLKLDSAHVLANERLAFILGIEGRRWESVPYLLAPIRAGRISMEQLLLLATVDSRGAEHEELIAASRRVNPDDWVPLIGTARVKFVEGKFGRIRNAVARSAGPLAGTSWPPMPCWDAWSSTAATRRSSRPGGRTCRPAPWSIRTSGSRWACGHRIMVIWQEPCDASGKRSGSTRIISAPTIASRER